MSSSIYLWDKFSRGTSGFSINPKKIGGAGGGPATFFNDTVLQFPFNEASGSTTFTDASINGFTGTGGGGAQTNGTALTMDGSSDYVTLSSDPHDWNFFHNGSRVSIEVLLDGWPTNTNNVLLDTTAFTGSKRGLTIDLRGAKTVRVYKTRAAGAGTTAEIDVTTGTLTTNAGTNHLVIQYDTFDGDDTTNKVQVGLNGSRVFQGDVGLNQSLLDASHDMLISGFNGSTAYRFNGEIIGMRITRDRLPYDLENNASYTAPTSPDDWPTSEPATGLIGMDAPRFFPKEETAAAGDYDVTNYYHSEPRFIDLPTAGEVLAIFMQGASHSATTSTKIESVKSTDYGRTFPVSSRVLVTDDATHAARNHAVGVDSNGVIICAYRKTNASDVGQGVFYKTSSDNGATWSAETEITSKLTGATTAAKTIPFGRGVETSNGLMFTFYTGNFAELLYWDAGTTSFGTASGLYDYTASPQGYNEPFAIRSSTDKVTWFARKDDANNNDFIVLQTTDGGSTITDLGEVNWSATDYAFAAPIGGGIVNDKVVLVFCSRGPTYGVHYSTSTIANFEVGPKRMLDGTETLNQIRTMHQNGSVGVDYGYPEIIEQDGKGLFGWYEGLYGNVARLMNFVLDVGDDI